MNQKRTKQLIALFSLAATLPLAAQSVTNQDQGNQPAGKPADEEVLQLSPFEVTSTKDTGYVATETLAGTRIRTELKDVGAAISVITKDFLNDVGATDNNTLLMYTTNAEVSGTRGTYAGLGNGSSVDESGSLRSTGGANNRVRGLAQADNARDYFITDIPWDSYNADRIDILRGPNSILFGLGSPAGIVNASTRNAEFRDMGSAEVRVGSYGSARASVDINQQLINKVLAFRFDMMGSDQKYQQKPAFQNDRRYSGAIRFDPQLFKDRSFKTSIKIKMENGDITANRPRIVPPNDSLSPWWNSTTVSASNPFGGMGKTVINNAYDLFRSNHGTDTTGATIPVVAGDGFGAAQSSTANYQPWLSDMVNQQQPYWTIDGTTNQLYRIFGGYVNVGARNTSGGFTGASNGIVNKNQNASFVGLGSLPAAANNYKLANYQYGQYRTMTLLDPSVFDYNNILIDGNTKKEWEHWNTVNVDVTQTAWNDKVGIEFTYDRQRYRNGGQALLGGSPTLSIDILKNFADYYTSGANGTTSQTNPNFGRAFVTSSGGSGSSYYSDRKYTRLSLFGEVSGSDFSRNALVKKIIGKQRLNVVGSKEDYYNENRSWQMFANSQAWAAFWNGTDGSSSSIADRQPTAFIYLGSSLANRNAVTGSNLPGISSNVTFTSGSIYYMDPSWTASGVSYTDPWTVPANMQSIYSATTNGVSTMQQVSNPANMKGWSYFQDNLLSYGDGNDLSLLTKAQKSLRETKSYSGSYQSYLWKDAFVMTLGWRFDQVQTKDVTAQQQSLNRSILNINPDVYKLPDAFPLSQIFKGHSTSGGAVLHLNKILDKDYLPINVSVSYNESSNFQVTSVRRDVYGTPIGNPSGKTYEKGVLLSTKDGKFSFRYTDYTTRVSGASSQLSNAGGIGSAIQQGLKWRNVFLYQLGGYDWATRNQDSYRNRWTNGYPSMTDADALAMEDKAIAGWNDIQKYLETKGFFKAWNFTPTTASALTTRSAYLSNPASFVPDAATVYAYVATAPQGFTVTADTESKGHEYEFVANPLPNWRIAINASETVAIRRNVGGAALSELVAYMDKMLYNTDGSLTPAGSLFQFGGAGNSIAASNYGPWKANYTLMKLQEGTPSPELRKWRYNIVSNYSFTRGFVKGLGVGAGYRWQDKVIIGYPVTAKGSFDLSLPVYGPKEDAVDLWTSYERKLTKKLNWKIQINVRNAFAKDKLIPITIEPDGKTTASARVAPVQEWFLTNTVSF